MTDYLIAQRIGGKRSFTCGDLNDALACVDDSDRYPILDIRCVDGTLVSDVGKYVARRWFDRWIKSHNPLWDADNLPEFVRSQIGDVIREAEQDARDEARHLELECMV
jgi:hypothetical protein